MLDHVSCVNYASHRQGILQKTFFHGLFFRTTPVNNIQRHVANVSQALVQIAPPMLESVHRQENLRLRICSDIEDAWADKNHEVMKQFLNMCDWAWP